jgi:hypothetical protein
MTTPDVISGAGFYHGKNDANTEGARVVEGLRSGVLATINACVRTFKAVCTFKDDADAIDAFLIPLVEAGILSPREARLGLASPKLAMLCKVGEYADRLLDDRIIQYCLKKDWSGYTLLYGVAVLFDQTSNDQDDATRIGQLADTLQRKEVENRQDILHLTRALKQAKRNESAGDAGLINRFQSPVPAEIFRGYDLVLSAPTPFHLRKLRDDDFTGPLPRCLRIGEIVADSAIFAVLAPLSDLPVIENKLLPGCGFAGAPPRVFLLHLPDDPEITGARMLVVAERRLGDIVRSYDAGWLPQGEPVDPFALAAQLAPDARHKLNLFASADVDGYRSIIGQANWSLTDE